MHEACSYQKNEAFPIENIQRISEAEALRRNIVSYLAEYRFELPKYSFEQVFLPDHYGNYFLSDAVTHEPMIQKAERTLALRSWGNPMYEKAVADLKGMRRLDQLVTQAHAGDLVIYASPHDRQIGYTYGFFYVGRVQVERGFKKVQFTSIRINGEHAMSNYRDALMLIANKPVLHETPNDFIAYPQLVTHALTDADIDHVLGSVFNFKPDEKSQLLFDYVIQKLRPYIDDFITMVEQNVDLFTLRKAFYALENYVLEQKQLQQLGGYHLVVASVSQQVLMPLPQFINSYGHEPPKVMGSCGSTGTHSMFSTGSAILDKILGIGDEQDWFECPNCGHKADGPVGNRCPGCGITKEEYAKKTKEKMCD